MDLTREIELNLKALACLTELEPSTIFGSIMLILLGIVIMSIAVVKLELILLHLGMIERHSMIHSYLVFKFRVIYSGHLC